MSEIAGSGYERVLNEKRNAGQFTVEERTAAQTRLDAIDPVVVESEKRFAADPDAWLAAERAKCERIGIEMRASAHRPKACPIVDGQYSDLQSVSVRPI